MSVLALRRLRICILFLAAIILIVVVAMYSRVLGDHGLLTYQYLRWRDRVIISTAFIFFFTYFYALKGKPFLHKYLRAFLMFACSALVLYTHIVYIAEGFQLCESTNVYCHLIFTIVYMNTIFGFLTLFEIALTLKTGPLQPKTQPYGLHGYGDQANVVIVSPDQLQGYYPSALQQPIIISHPQNHHYPHYPQYPQHQFTHAAPVPAQGDVIEIKGLPPLPQS